ncbi:MAG TPA: YfiR family protein [Methylococcaceae bacterium]|nr:YfiR family protein [Methylococcaceae bacterium]
MFRHGLTLASRNFLLGLLALLAPAFAAWGEAVPEYALKAAFLYNFARFTEWPAQPPAQEFNLCIYGKNPFGERLDTIAGKPLHGNPVRIVLPDTLDSLGGCHILFIAESALPSLPRVLAALDGRAVLTVAEGEGRVEQGIMVGLLLEGSRVAFEVNLSALRHSGISVSAQLLQLSRRVQ